MHGRYSIRIVVIAAALIVATVFGVSTSLATYGDTVTFIGQLYDGDGEQAVDAYFDFPDDMVRDGSGVVYVADTYNNVIRSISTGGVVSTFAGTGSAGLVNGTAGNAEFYLPRGIAVDGSGNVYVADSGNNAIRKISGGSVTTLVSAGLSGPLGLHVIGGTLYIADSGNNAIKSVSTGGGSVSTLSTGVSDPRKMTSSADGSLLYVADNGNHRIVSVSTSTGAVTVIAGSTTAGYVEGTGSAARFENVWGIVRDGNTLYVTDHDAFVTDRIRTINLSTGATALFASDQQQQVMIYPGALYIADGYLHALMTGLGTIHRFLLTDSATHALVAGKERFNNRIGTGTGALIGRPLDLTPAPDGTYVYFSENNKIRKFNKQTGEIIQVIGSTVDNYREGSDAHVPPMRFSGPSGITVNSTGTRLYVADRWNNRIRMVNLETSPATATLLSGAGLINTNGTQDNGYQDGVKCDGQLNTGVSGCAYFKNPAGIVIDPSNAYLYVTDTGNNRVRKVRISDGQTSLVAGSGEAGFADGTGGAAKFNKPFGITLDPTGQFLYVADTNNQRIRKIVIATGAVSTLIGTGTNGYLDAAPTSAVLSFPEYVKTDTAGDVYFTEAGSHRIRVLDISANVTKLVAGSGVRGFVNGTASASRFNNLKGMYVDLAQAKLYVADSWNDVIRRVDLTGGAPFTEPAPQVTGVTPKDVNPSWNTGSGLQVKITGKNFRHGAVALFANHAAEQTYVVSSTEVVARLPLSKMSPGVYDVSVKNSDSQQSTLVRGFNLTNTNGTSSSAYYPFIGTTTTSTPETIAVAPGASFFAWPSNIKGGFYVASGNVSGDGKDEIVVGAGNGLGPQVRILNAQGTVLRSFFAYDSTTRTGVRLAVCDTDGDGQQDIVTISGPGAVPLVKVFSGAGTLKSSFSALDGKFKGGAYLACGDVNGDGTSDIVVAAGRGGGAQVTVHLTTGKVIANFFAYAQTFRGGIKVVTADTDGDGKDEIITGPEFGAPHIQTFQIRPNEIKRLNPGWYAFSKDYRGGVSLTGADVDGDGSKEIVVGVGENAQPLVKVLNKSGTIEVKKFYAYATSFLSGVHVSAGDVDGDGIDEVLVLPRGGGGANVRIIEVDKLK